MKTLAAAALLAAFLIASPVRGQAQKAPSADVVANATGGVNRAMDASAAAWNRGDVRAFMDCYDNSPETTFVGKTVTHGWQQVMDSYLKNYGTPAKMGHLDFSDLQVRVLDEQTAVATGRFHLRRTSEGGGDASGIFSLVFVKTAAGWKIVLDHTANDDPAK